VTFSRLFNEAYLNANSATRLDACSVINLILCTTPLTIYLNRMDDLMKQKLISKKRICN
jgi:hypothetical protein